MPDNIKTLVTTTSGERMPLSYVEFLRIEGYNNLDTVDIFNRYNSYVKEWYENAKTTKENNLPSISKILYRNFLEEIALRYTTDDEKRFLSNIDLNSDKDLDIIIPFYVKKLKEITKYYKSERHNIEHTKVKHNLKSSVLGVKALVTDLILDLLNNKDFTDKYPNANIPTLSAVSNSIQINVNELYDEHQFYLNSKNNEAYNTEEIDSNVYLAVQDMIADLVAESSPTSLASDISDSITTSDNFTLVLNTDDTVDINDVDINRFVGASKTLEDLISTQQKELFEKFNSSGYNYLSAGTTSTTFVTGSLFKPENVGANLLNAIYSSHATAPVLSETYLATERGGFFSPDKQGLLKFESVNLITEIDLDKIQPNTLYVFPAPDAIETPNAPYKFTDNNEIIKFSKANDGAYGIPSNKNAYQRFYPYQSRTETLNLDVEGVSRSIDSIDFWSGEEADVWANDDVYSFEGLTVNVNEREDDLLIGSDYIQEWRTDLFGNNFALHKDTHIIRKTQEQIDNLSGTPISDFNALHLAGTEFDDFKVKYFNHQGSKRITIYETLTETITSYQNLYTKQSKQGKLYHRNYNTSKTDHLSAALSAVFIKYNNTNILEEINNNVIDFDLIDNVLIITTPTYQVVEKYSYNYETDTYKSLLPGRIFLSAGGGLEQIGKPWYDETKKDLYLCKTTVADYFSNTYGKIIFPVIKKINIDSNDLTNLNILSGTGKEQFKKLKTEGYSLSGTSKKFNISNIDKPQFKINKKDNVALVSLKAKDQGDKSYFLNYYYNSLNQPYTVKNIAIVKPDINIYNLDVGSFPTLTVSQEDGYKDEVSVEGSSNAIEAVASIAGTELSATAGVSGVFVAADNIIKLGTYYDTDDLGVPNTIDPDTQTPFPYTNNSSYLLFKLPLSATSRDIEVSFDIAVFNNNNGNESYFIRTGVATTELITEARGFITTELGVEIHTG